MIRYDFTNNYSLNALKKFLTITNTHHNIQTNDREQKHLIVDTESVVSKEYLMFEKLLGGNTSLLSRLRSIKDYEILMSYIDQSQCFFIGINEFSLPQKVQNILIAQKSPLMIGNEYIINVKFTNHRYNINKVRYSNSYRPLAISTFGDYAILKNRDRYWVQNNIDINRIPISFLDNDKHYTFKFNHSDRNFAVVDHEGNFTFVSVFGQPQIKLKLHLDSYLDLRSVYGSSYIITDHAIYNFSGDSLYSSHQKFVFHYLDEDILIRENFLTQQIEVVYTKSSLQESYPMHSERLIHHIHVNDDFIVINYEDELLQFIKRASHKYFSAFTKERIRSTSLDQSKLYILLVDNTVQIIELKN
jgi:hypothetical protein